MATHIVLRKSLDGGFVISDDDRKLTAQEFIEMSKVVGWGKDAKYDLSKVKKALKNTSYIVTIRDDGRIIACGRALSDDMFFTTIPDLFVRPEYQGKGLGRA